MGGLLYPRKLLFFFPESRHSFRCAIPVPNRDLSIKAFGTLFDRGLYKTIVKSQACPEREGYVPNFVKRCTKRFCGEVLN